MGDRFTEVQETSFGQNIMASIKGVVIGLILFLASFIVLWWNEGRIDMSEVAETSIPVSAETVDGTSDGKFVSVTGRLKSEESIGDPQFLEVGPYIMLNRKAEMYCWEEKKSTRSKKKLGGGKRTETTYDYSKTWSEKPSESSSFKKPEGHTNPHPCVDSRSFRVREATLGAYRLDPQSVRLPNPSHVSITADAFIPSSNARLEGDYIFIGKGTLQNPEIGDMRISFGAVESDTTATLFGKLNRDTVEPYHYKGEKKLYRAIAGSREAAIAKMASEHRITTWLLRAAGFLMMWIGLGLFFGPINAVLDFIPLLGGMSRSIIGLAMFIIALGLSLLTILVSTLAHNPLLLIGSIVVLLTAIWALGRMRTKQKPAKAYAKTNGTPSRPERRIESTTPGDQEEAMQLATQKRESASEKIRFECEECGKRYNVRVSLAGKKATCKECGHKFQIPIESTK